MSINNRAACRDLFTEQGFTSIENNILCFKNFYNKLVLQL